MKTKKQKEPAAKELLEKMREDNRDLFAEIADFAALLRECGVTSYKLTGALQAPIITNYSVS